MRARRRPTIIHFDGYRMGAELNSPFKPGEHIPGLNVGGWQDAGDYDIQTPSNAWVVRDLVWGRELFGLDWDETSVDEAAHAVQIRKPDGVQDSLQQIRHGMLQLLAQYKVFGHAIVGIIVADAASNIPILAMPLADRPHDLRSEARANESKGDYSGKPDDRWAFTTDYPGQRSDRWRARWPAPAGRWRPRIRHWPAKPSRRPRPCGQQQRPGRRRQQRRR